ncbi:hypothetical protein IE81DRAFT_347579 [Ceraceosorus guamensis]|uniref:Uncharacterized protein n=1 Tax=Ceraceosorus guamensis TaxID=1522189 RepID=A0A316VYB9_9BASI|nr:hypothetical protein IE81DRAFT_347579 [Ceraceosorus guamensis]PWN42324.1 hypothetical protein IE81DRAFT_347579 [Ceraceosorus guamensis]
MPALASALAMPAARAPFVQPRVYDNEAYAIASTSRRQLNSPWEFARLDDRRWAVGSNSPVLQASASGTGARVVADSSGHFNGSCKAGPQTSAGDTLPPNAGQGACVSFIPDITSYCCIAVGGTEVNVTSPAPTSDNAAPEEVWAPECRTTNYADMLDCYMVTVEDHCARESVGPFGFCNPSDAADTSYSINHSSSAAPSLSMALRRPRLHRDFSTLTRCKMLLAEPLSLILLTTALTSAVTSFF